MAAGELRGEVMRTIRDCNVCVVGGAGFLGSHLVHHLVKERNCRVLVVDNLVVGRLDFLPKRGVDFEHHDITGSEDYLRKLLRGYGAKSVFNYAAYPYIPDSFERPLHVADVNFMGAVKVINAAQEAGVESILQVSSAEIYGEGASGFVSVDDAKKHGMDKIDENGKVVPHSTYGVAKAAVDSFVQCAWMERRTPAIALRQFNCVGERETHPYVVPEIVSQLNKHISSIAPDGTVWYRESAYKDHQLCPTVYLGNNSFRDFLYAGDQARIAVELLERGQFGEVYNLGSETGVKIYDLAKLIGKVMGFADVKVVEDEKRKRPWEIWHLQSDNSKIRNVLTSDEFNTEPKLWNPTPLEKALRKTVAWFNENGRKWPWEA